MMIELVLILSIIVISIAVMFGIKKYNEAKERKYIEHKAELYKRVTLWYNRMHKKYTDNVILWEKFHMYLNRSNLSEEDKENMVWYMKAIKLKEPVGQIHE